MSLGQETLQLSNKPSKQSSSTALDTLETPRTQDMSLGTAQVLQSVESIKHNEQHLSRGAMNDPQQVLAVQSLVREALTKQGLNNDFKMTPGVFDAETERAVKLIQGSFSVSQSDGSLVRVGPDTAEKGLHRDGIVGPRTIDVLLKASGNQSAALPFEQFKQVTSGVWDVSQVPANAPWMASDLPNAYRDKAKLAELSGGFYERVNQISSELNIKPEWLMAVMNFESGLDPKAVNPYSGATGLIQFMPKTARNLGTSTAELRNMPAEAQLSYVRDYLHDTARGRPINSLNDLYSLVFYPAAFGKSDEHTIGTAGGAVYNQNRILDYNRDGRIAKGEISRGVESKFRSMFPDKTLL